MTKHSSVLPGCLEPFFPLCLCLGAFLELFALGVFLLLRNQFEVLPLLFFLLLMKQEISFVLDLQFSGSFIHVLPVLVE